MTAYEEVRAAIDALGSIQMQGNQLWLDDVIVAEASDPIVAEFLARAPRLAQLALLIHDEHALMGTSSIPPDIFEEAIEMLEELTAGLQPDSAGDEPHV